MCNIWPVFIIVTTSGEGIFFRQMRPLLFLGIVRHFAIASASWMGCIMLRKLIFLRYAIVLQVYARVIRCVAFPNKLCLFRNRYVLVSGIAEQRVDCSNRIRLNISWSAIRSSKNSIFDSVIIKKIIKLAKIFRTGWTWIVLLLQRRYVSFLSLQFHLGC